MQQMMSRFSSVFYYGASDFAGCYLDGGTGGAGVAGSLKTVEGIEGAKTFCIWWGCQPDWRLLDPYTLE